MKKILCTIGPTSLNEKTLRRLEELGVSLFRINLSHTAIESLEPTIDFIRKYSQVPICLDTEGAQVRTGFISSKKKYLETNESLVIEDGPGPLAKGCLSLYPSFIKDELVVGDLLSIDFDSALIQVVSTKHAKVEARVISSGWVGNNKAVTVLRPIHLSPLTAKDKRAVEIGSKCGIENYALSFANSPEDVELLRKLVKKGSHIISKIESIRGYKNLGEILKVTDAILIDRGDLSREVPIETIPFYQKNIIKAANRVKKPVYVATNLLESMTEHPNPTRAEVNDVINALMLGADGLVLAGETAIGSRPIEAATMIVKLIRQYQLAQNTDITKTIGQLTSSLVAPHGGQLVMRWEKEPNWSEVKQLKKLKVPHAAIMDCEQIGIGTYSPIEGFMTRSEIHSVLDLYRLPSGVIWTKPIVLQKEGSKISGLKVGKTIALVNEEDNKIYATLRIKDIYRFPFDEVSSKWFGTVNPDHPGVARLKSGGDCFIGGDVTLLRRRNAPTRRYEFTPAELRHIFDKKGWHKVIGFHTRDIVHRGHEVIQRMALELTHSDGLLISPAIGETKQGDLSSKIIMDSYQLLIDKGVLDKNKVFVGALASYSSYAGHREAVFTALCRKNFGCSHFIEQKDDTSHELIQKLGGIGITPVSFNEVKYCKLCDECPSQCDHLESAKISVSGAQVREHLANRINPPSWLMRSEISALIINEMKSRS